MTYELRPVLCKCGGIPDVGECDQYESFEMLYWVRCPKCRTMTETYEDENEAIREWNWMMSVPECAAPWDPDRNRYCCERCGHYVGKYDAYCGGCGAKLTDYTPDGRGKKK